MKWKFGIAFCALALGLVLLYQMLRPAPAGMQEAFVAFSHGHAEKTELILEQLKLTEGQKELYAGYIALNLGNGQVANTHFSEAQELARKEEDRLLAYEATFMRMFVAYELGNQGMLTEQLAMARELDRGNNAWLSFFEGLHFFLKGNYAKAILNWKNPGEQAALSPWMRFEFNKVFTNFWMLEHFARCHIEVGNFLAARQMLDQGKREASAHEREKIELLLALSYLREGESENPLTALPYYRLAISHLDQSPIGQQDPEVIYLLVKESSSLLVKGHIEATLPLLQTLKRWGQESAIKELQPPLAEAFMQELSRGRWKRVGLYTELLNPFVQDLALRQQIGQRFARLVEQALELGDHSQMGLFWKGVQTYAPDPNAFSKQFAQQIETVLEHSPIQDEKNIESVERSLHFWKQIVQDPEREHLVALHLLEGAVRLWNRGDYKTSGRVLDLARQTSLDPVVQKAIREAIIKFYEKGTKNGDFSAVQSSFALSRRYKVPIAVPLEDIEERLESAQEAFAKENMAEAQTLAEWTLLLDPDSREAVQMVAKAAYERADYQTALRYLGVGKSEAHVVSLLLAGDAAEGERLLEERGTLSREGAIRLGFGYLEQEAYPESLHWLEQVDPPTNEVFAALTYFTYLKGNWEGVLENFRQLTPPFNDLTPLQGLVVEAYVALGQGEKAEEMAKGLQKRPLPAFSPYFITFLQERLRRFTAPYIKAYVAQKVAYDPEAAYAYLSTISDPSSETELVKGDLLVELGDLQRAEAPYLVAWRGGLQVAAGRLGSLYAQMGRDLDAFFYFQKGGSEHTDKHYLAVLRRVGRFDLAYKEYQKGSIPDPVGYAETLLRLGKLKEAKEVVHEIMEGEYPLVLKLKIAPLTRYTRAPFSLPAILAEAEEELTTKRILYLAPMLLANGNIFEAEQVVEPHIPDLEQHARGLTLLARLFSHLSDPQTTGNYSVKALNKRPYDLQALHLYFSTFKGELRLKTFAEPYEGLTGSLDAQWIVARTLVARAEYSHLEIDVPPSFALHRARTILQRCLNQCDAVAPLWATLALDLALLDEPYEAQLALEQAFILDSTNSEAHRVAALLTSGEEAVRHLEQAALFNDDAEAIWIDLIRQNAQLGNIATALEWADKGVKWYPNNPKFFLQLAQLSLKVRNPEKARRALERAHVLDPDSLRVLRLLYQVLHDPDLLNEADDVAVVVARQEQVIELIRSLNPKEAQQLLSQREERS